MHIDLLPGFVAANGLPADLLLHVTMKDGSAYIHQIDYLRDDEWVEIVAPNSSAQVINRRPMNT